MMVDASTRYGNQNIYSLAFPLIGKFHFFQGMESSFKQILDTTISLI